MSEKMLGRGGCLYKGLIRLNGRANGRVTAAVFAAAGLGLAAGANATALQWLGTNPTTWEDASNWSGGVVPTSSTDALFNLTSYPNQPVVTATDSVMGLIFGDNLNTAAGAISIGNSSTGSLVIGFDGIVAHAGSLADVISGPMNMSGSALIRSDSTAGVTLLGSILTGNSTTFLTGNGSSTLSNINSSGGAIGTGINGSGGVVYSGTGVGHIKLNASLITGGVVINSGTLSFDQSLFSGNPFSSNQTVIVNGGGTLLETTSHALGGNNNGAANAVILNPGASWNISSSQYVTSLQMTGATANGAGDFRSASNFSTITTLASSTASTINANLTVNFGNFNFAVASGTVPSGVDLQLNSPISGTFGIAKSGAGSLLLNAAETYTGSTIVNGGILTLGSTGSINASSGLFTGGGTLLIPAANPVTQTFAGLNVIAGTSTISNLGANTLTLNAFNRSAGGVINFAAGTVTSTSANVLNTGGQQSILGGYATINGNTWAVASNTAGSPTTLTGLTSYSSTFASSADVDASGSTAPAAMTINSLRFNTVGSSTVSPTGTLAVSTGGILETSAVGNNPVNITGGALTAINANSGGDLVVIQNNTASSMTIGSVIANDVAPAGQTGTTANGSTGITGLSSTSGLYVGMPVFGTNVSTGAKITAITSPTSITISSAVTADGSASLTFASANGFTKAGPGSLTLTGANTYTGPTFVSGGTLSIAGDTNLGTAPASASAGNIVINGGALSASTSFTLSSTRGIALGTTAGPGLGTIDVSSGNTLTYGGVIANIGSGVGGLIKTGAGTLSLSGFSTYGGGTTVNAGTLTLAAGGPTAPIRGNLTINASATVSTTIGDALGYGGASFDINNIYINGGLFNNASASNQGFLTNIFMTGGTMNSSGGGSINFSNGYGITSYPSATTSLINAPLVARAGSLVFTVNQGTTSTGTDLKVVGNISTNGGSGIIKNGPGTLTLSSNSYTFSGTTTINAGTLNLNGGSGSSAGVLSASPLIIVNTGGTLQLSSVNSDILGYTSNRDQLAIYGGTVVNTGARATVQNTITMVGGTLATTGSAVFEINNATGFVATSDAYGNPALVTGAIPLNLNSTFNVTQGATAPASDMLVTSSITPYSGAGTITKTGNGILTLANTNTYTTATTISAGTLQLGDGTAGHDGSLASPVVNNASLVFNINGAKSLAGAISGSGTVTKNGAGVQTLAGSSTYTGVTNINAGTLLVAGSLNSTPTVTVANLATVGGSGTINSTVNINSGASVQAGINGAGTLTLSSLNFLGTSTVNFGTLTNYNSTAGVNVTGSGLLNPTGGSNSVTINIASVAGTTIGNTYKLIGYSGGIGGSGFSSFQLGSLPSRATGSLINNPNEIDLQITGTDSLVWTGLGSVANGWDTTTTNWKLASNGSPTTYIDSPGDAVLFDDSASPRTTVNINTAVHPSAITFNNSSTNYTVAGTAGIAGSTGITELGTGGLTLSTSNNFTGPVAINAGSLSISADNNLGAIPGIPTTDLIINGGKLSLTAPITISANRSVTVNAGGATIDLNSNAVTLGGLLSGTGGLVVNNTGNGSGGVLSLTNTGNTESGPLTINSGTVVLGALGVLTPTGNSIEQFSSITVNAGTTLVTAGTHVFGYNGATIFKPALIVNGGTITNTTTAHDNYLGTVTMTGGLITGAGDYRLQGSPQALFSTNAAAAPAVVSIPSLQLYTNALFTVASGTTPSGIDLSITSNISGGAFTLTKAGPGVMSLSGFNNYSGGTVVSGGTLLLASTSALPAYQNLNIGSGATVQASNFSGGIKNTPFVNTLSIGGGTGAWTGKLELGNNDLVVRTGNISDLTDQVKQGYNGGAWNASAGITSSAAATDAKHLTALGAIVNDDGTGSGTALVTTFDGQPTNPGDLLVKYSYYGDTNLDGKVDGTDYSRIDNGYLTAATGWFNGDFNYDGLVNGSDYTLIDNAYNTQGAVIASAVASAQVASQIAPTGSAGSSVPEPTTLGLLGLGAIGLLGRRRR